MMYVLYKIEATTRGTSFTARERYKTMREALAAAPAFGWGQYVICDGEGRRVAHVRLAPPVVARDIPLVEADTVAA